MVTDRPGAGEPDARAFADLYQAQFGRVYAYLRWRADDPAAAEDLTAEVFGRAWAHRAAELAPDAAVAWLFTTARRLVADRYRGRPAPLPLAAVSLE